MKTLTIVIAFLGCLSGPVANSQQGLLRLTASYSIALPGNDLKGLTPDVSPRGGDLSFVYGITDKLSLGLAGSYQDFYEKYPRQVYTTEDGTDISAVMSNSIQLIPVLVTARYNLMQGKMIQPYVGVGAGANIILFRQTLGEYNWASQDKIGFAARPEAGVFIPVSKSKLVGINLSAVYNYMPFKYGELDNVNNFAFRLGISLPLRD